MKILIAYFSRSGNTEQIAKKIQSKLNCDIELIDDGRNYNGPIGWLKGGFNAMAKRPSSVKIKKNPKDYDLVIIGTPVWASTMSSPVFSYLIETKDQINKLAAFCTTGGSGYNETLKDIEEVSGKKLVSKMYITAKELDTTSEKINSFITNI